MAAGAWTALGGKVWGLGVRDQLVQLGHVTPHFALQPLLALFSGLDSVFPHLLGCLHISSAITMR